LSCYKAVYVDDILRHIALEHEIDVIFGKIVKDYVNIFCRILSDSEYQHDHSMAQRYQLADLAFRICPHTQAILDRPLWARGYLVICSDHITGDMIQQFIDARGGEPIVDNSRFQIDEPKIFPFTDEGRLVDYV
jgi:putative transposase